MAVQRWWTEVSQELHMRKWRLRATVCLYREPDRLHPVRIPNPAERDAMFFFFPLRRCLVLHTYFFPATLRLHRAFMNECFALNTVFIGQETRERHRVTSTIGNLTAAMWPRCLLVLSSPTYGRGVKTSEVLLGRVCVEQAKQSLMRFLRSQLPLSENHGRIKFAGFCPGARNNLLGSEYKRAQIQGRKKRNDPSFECPAKT